MSAESQFRCPVCRAAQTLRETCRRCQADLSLVVRAHRRLAHLESLLANAEARGDAEQAKQIQSELRWLVPARPE
jgi:hypothetical protein